MKAAVVYGINDLRLEEIEKPQIERDDQILVKIKAVGTVSYTHLTLPTT